MFSEQFLKDEDFAKKYVQEQLQKLSTKTVSNVWFPLGMRKIKFKTVLSLDGYEVWVNGKASGGKQLLLSSAESLLVSKEMEAYIKKLENYKRKKDERKNVLLDEVYDGISKSENIRLYESVK